jgi:hypothetical protein
MAFGISFDALYNFLQDLAEAFPDTSAQRYFDLLKDIKVSDREAQGKHVSLFTAFCVSNRHEILEKRIEGLRSHKIGFDDNEAPFDMQEIVEHKEFESNRPDILRHLLTISAIVDPESGAKQILSSMESSNLFNDSGIADLFGNITRDIEATSGDGEFDPASAIENIVKAPSFKKLISSIMQKTQNGEIDLSNLLSGMAGVGKLMEGVQKPAN